MSATVTASSSVLSPKEMIGSAWSRFGALARNEDRQDLIDELKPAIQRFELGIFRLVVVGEIKKGKSSFINALLGQPDLLPTATDIATSTVYKILYGPARKLKVFFAADADTGRRREPLEIQPDQLADYGTETGNPGNRQGVDFIGVELPHPLLRDGLVIVDTPGVGGLYRKHRDITWRYAPNADAICFVLDSVESVISRDEIEFLRDLTTKVTKRVFFVQTKIDAADSEQWRAWAERNQDVLATELRLDRSKMFYFPLSARTKNRADTKKADAEIERDQLARLLRRSGFDRYVEFLHQGLMRQKSRHLANDTAERLLQGCSELDRTVAERLRISSAQSREELDRIAGEFGAAKTGLAEWERSVLPRETERFTADFSDLRRKTELQLQEQLDPSGPIVGEVISELRSMEFDPGAVSGIAGEIQQRCLEMAAKVVGDLQAQFNREAIALIQRVADALADGLQVSFEMVSAPSVASSPIRIQDSLGVHYSGFEKLRTGMFGGMIGASVASLVTILFPPAGPIVLVATILGSMYGGKKAVELEAQKKREEVVTKLERLLGDTMRKAARQSLNVFGDNCAKLDREARRTFTSAAARMRKEVQARLAEIEVARNRSREDTEAERSSLQARLKQIRELVRHLKDRIEVTA